MCPETILWGTYPNPTKNVLKLVYWPKRWAKYTDDNCKTNKLSKGIVSMKSDRPLKICLLILRLIILPLIISHISHLKLWLMGLLLIKFNEYLFCLRKIKTIIRWEFPSRRFFLFRFDLIYKFIYLFNYLSNQSFDLVHF